MSESVNTPHPSASNAPSTPPAGVAAPTAASPESQPNAAVQRCVEAYRKAYLATRGSGTTDAKEAGAFAFKAALPYLVSRPAIVDFIACVTQGMVLRVFWHDEGPKLINAARAAHAAAPHDPAPAHMARPAGRPPKNISDSLLEN